jgi:adenylate cyclase
VDKYIGDAVMAFWNAPSDDANHSLHACESALRCVRATEELFKSPRWSGRPGLETRFGIHRATVLVGHFGAPDRLNYTAIGDGVNTASRLEGLNKEYGTSILVSEPVYNDVREHFAFRLLDVVAVKGKKQSLKVYELLGRTGETPANLPAARNYEAAFGHYREGAFAEALKILRENGDDAPSRVLTERCEQFMKGSSEAQWDGVFHASKK